jgi:L-amino acid N-acyltransferase YncA
MDPVMCTGSGDVRKHQIVVRRPDAGDYPSMLEIANWATSHTTANFRHEAETLEDWVRLSQSRSEAYPWYVAERVGRVIAYAMACPFQHRCGFAPLAEVSVYVHPDHIGTGVGSALYRELIPALAVQGFQSLVAMITLPNAGSERLHERFGFRRVGVLSRLGWKFGRWHDVAYWQLLLRNDEAAPVPLKCGCAANSSRAGLSVRLFNRESAAGEPLLEKARCFHEEA